MYIHICTTMLGVGYVQAPGNGRVHWAWLEIARRFRRRNSTPDRAKRVWIGNQARIMCLVSQGLV